MAQTDSTQFSAKQGRSAISVRRKILNVRMQELLLLPLNFHER
jgi:hypothetical protein